MTFRSMLVCGASALVVVALATHVAAKDDALADHDGDGKVSAAERAGYEWLSRHLESPEADEFDGEEVRLPVDAKYLDAGRWRQVRDDFMLATQPNQLLEFSDRKGALPVDLFADADGLDRHVFTVEARLDQKKKDDPSDDVLLIDIYDPARGHGDASSKVKGELPVAEVFNNFKLRDETVRREGKSPPKSLYGEAFALLERKDAKNGQAAFILSVGPGAQGAYALTVFRDQRGQIRGRLWREQAFHAAQEDLGRRVEAARVKIRAAAADE